MLLSDTQRGRNWLSNFREDERATATLLLDALELVGQDELRIALTELIQTLRDELATPIALVPVRELDYDQGYYPNGRDAKPRLLPTASFPGSEAIIANILTGAHRAETWPKPFLGSPSLRNMRAAKCHTIVLVDDFSGSGHRITRFLRGLRKHKTLQSWVSYGLIEFHVAVYSATPRALRRLEIVFGPDKVHIHKVCPTIANRKWDPADVESVKRLCRTYLSDRLISPSFGYDSTGSLLAFSHCAPNNLPTILWQEFRYGHPSWFPFFMDKGVPLDIHAQFGQDNDERKQASALRRLRQPAHAAILWSQLPSNDARDMMLVLTAVGRRARSRELVAELTGLALPEVRRAANLCQSFELIDQRLHLTDRGRRELGQFRTVRLAADNFQLNGSSIPYYPQKLRAGR